ncbi:hypothetical protein [Niabella aquatica]
MYFAEIQNKILYIADWPNKVIAISTVIYTLGTFLLWRISITNTRQNRKTISLTEEQIKRDTEIKQVEYISTIHKNFREVYSTFLKDEKSLQILSDNLGGTDTKIVRQNYLASFLINHAYELFEFNQYKLLPDDFWKRTEIDMRALFQWQFVNDRWQRIKTIYSPEFQKFIEEKILIIEC